MLGPRAVLLTCAEALPSALLTNPLTAARVRGVDVYALTREILDGCQGLLVSAHVDQRFLCTMKPELERFVDRGGTVVACGHVAYPFLTELEPFVPLAAPSLSSYTVWRVREHEIFAGVRTDELTFRRGVAGFYGRGHNPPPAGALILHRLGGADGPPVDWLVERPGGGRVFVHAGNDLWVDVGEPTSAARIAPQLLTWIERPSSNLDRELT